jgi:hypothetical protein
MGTTMLLVNTSNRTNIEPATSASASPRRPVIPARKSIATAVGPPTRALSATAGNPRIDRTRRSAASDSDATVGNTSR